MDSGHSSDTSHGEPELHSGGAMDTQTSVFKVMPEDADILNEYIIEFQEADTETRNRILEKAMGELYMLHTGNSPFDKKDIKQVSDLSTHI